MLFEYYHIQTILLQDKMSIGLEVMGDYSACQLRAHKHELLNEEPSTLTPPVLIAAAFSQQNRHYFVSESCLEGEICSNWQRS